MKDVAKKFNIPLILQSVSAHAMTVPIPPKVK